MTVVLTTNRNWPPLSSTLLNRDTVAGMLGTQCRQEKEVTREKEAELAEMKEAPCEESSCWNVMLGALGWWCCWQWAIMSSEMSTPTTLGHMTL